MRTASCWLRRLANECGCYGRAQSGSISSVSIARMWAGIATRSHAVGEARAKGKLQSEEPARFRTSRNCTWTGVTVLTAWVALRVGAMDFGGGAALNLLHFWAVVGRRPSAA